jgi:hypothetical protein
MNYKIVECDCEFLDIIEVHFEDGTVHTLVEVPKEYIPEFLDQLETIKQNYIEDCELYGITPDVENKKLEELFYYYVRGDIERV